MKDKIFKNLNQKQIEAVEIINGPVLVISGPGSGKTRCLTHRIAYLISQDIQANNILAVTFTNKAAGEMRERIAKLIDTSIPKSAFYSNYPKLPIIGTFHSIGLKILRDEITQLGYKRNFTVFDDDDQISLIKKVLAELELDIKNFNPRVILLKISDIKTKLISPEDYEPKDYLSEIVVKVYKSYQKNLSDLNAVDFNDLIALPIKIFKQNKETLNKYQEAWKYILVDEYQDTSYDQYIFINLLAEKYRNIFCIGDDAQSIYQFRRADIRNILNFQKDYPEAIIILLEQNYRSTKNIITAAQQLISQNKNQIQKSLWTENDHGEKIIIAETINERHEARFIVSKIEDYIKQDYTAKDFALLYRTHAQSRALEEVMIMNGYPYQIVGGLKFYERKEIKDILAYLKIINNPSDTMALERIYNIPPRGIGKALLEKIRSTKHETRNMDNPEFNILEIMKNSLENKTLPPKQLAAVSGFYKTLNDINKIVETKNLSGILKYIIKKIGYENYLKEFSLAKQKDYENLEDRLENLKELITVASKYEELPGKEGIEKILEEIAVLQDIDRSRTDPNKITLMTMHASKGLEFPVVFVVGMEEGLFPHSRTILNPVELEEERRLCYVGITRAKEHLILTYTKFRNIFGSHTVNVPSRFIGEIPSNLVDYQLMDSYYNSDDEEERISYDY